MFFLQVINDRLQLEMEHTVSSDQSVWSLQEKRSKNQKKNFLQDKN